MKRSTVVRFSAILAILLVPLVGSSQGLPATSLESSADSLHLQGAYVVREVGGKVICNDATPAEALQINAAPKVPLRVFGEDAGRVRTNASAGLNIILRGTAQLDANPTAKAAFERAADIWESRIANAITVYVDVDFGTTRFGEAFPDPNIIASASSDFRGGNENLYSPIRTLLVASSNNSSESALYGALPASTLPTDLGGTTRVVYPSMLLRAIGGTAAVAQPTDSAPSIGFNSAFPYDFEPSNGITAGTQDFEGVVVHEVGHMLGFVSRSGGVELGASNAPTIFDFFRFRPGVTSGTFGSASRVQSSGGDHVYFTGSGSLAMSTGRPDGTGGDENQASHWKDDALSGVRIGIMDPTLNRGTRTQLTDADLQAFGMMGWNIVSGGAPITGAPAAPSNLTATATSSSVIRLNWVDNSSNETEFRIEQRAGGSFVDLGSAPANVTTANITSFNPGTTATFRVRARNSIGDSAYTNEAQATTFSSGGGCVSNPTTVCLLSDRFRVSIAFINQFANPPAPGNFLGGKLVAGVQNPDVATFGISSAQAIEVVVRIQDARPFGLNRFDIYYGGLTDLEYTVTVTDVTTGLTRTYRNAPGLVGGGVDRTSFTALLGLEERITSGGYDSIHVNELPARSFSRKETPRLSYAAGAVAVTDSMPALRANAGGGGACTEVEPNDSPSTATPFTLGTPCTGNVSFTDPASITITYTDGTTDNVEDSFRFTTGSSGRITATLNFPSGDLDLFLYTVSGSTLNIVDASTGSSNTETFTTDTAVPAGTYYIGVSAFSGSSSYTLNVTSDGVVSPSGPAAPSNLTATGTSTSVIRLAWTDNSNNETEFRIEQRVSGSFVDIGSVGANSTAVNITNFSPGTTATFRVRARNASGDSGYSNEATGTTQTGGGPTTCSPNANTVCLLSDRFRVSIAFINQFANPPAPGNFIGAKLVAGIQNPDVATFGISSAQAIEVVVRIQDTRPFGLNRFDVYYGGLTDLEYTVSVTDTTTGTTRSYRNPPGTVGGGVDRTSFTAN